MKIEEGQQQQKGKNFCSGCENRLNVCIYTEWQCEVAGQINRWAGSNKGGDERRGGGGGREKVRMDSG